ncbi:jouberin-like, partial [Argonauta hians]
MDSGQYVDKQVPDRPVTFYYENKTPGINHILPMMTQPFDFKQKRSTLPMWEEVLLFNEDYSYFVQSDPKVIIFFEILDFVSMSAASLNYRKQPPHEGGWYNIAWAFLKVVGANQQPNTESKVRLQLFQPPSPTTKISQAHTSPRTPQVFYWWKCRARPKYPSTLYVTVKQTSLPLNIEPALRSMVVTQQEKGKSQPVSKHVGPETHLEIKKGHILSVPQWSRLDGQLCKVPKVLCHTLRAGWNGCNALKFSHDGRKIACGCHDVEEYPILIYEVTTGQLVNSFSGHFGLIYDVCWSTNDKFLCTASADGTARVWDSDSGVCRLLPHPSYVYCCSFHPDTAAMVTVTGGYDDIIRVWDVAVHHATYGQLLQELQSHKGYVNSLCFCRLGEKLYSGDSVGTLLMWKCHVGGSAGK